jgi:hypothetical protein
MQKIYIGKNNLVTILCPRCGKGSEIDTTPYIRSKSSARITLKFKCPSCDCGHKSCKDCKESNCTNGNTNVFQLERRKFFRKEVGLAGILFDRDGNKHPIRILDLSRTGVKMTRLSTRPITVGQHLVIEFTLDDAKQSQIKKEIIIRSTEDKLVAGEFTDIESYSHDDKMIGFYLMK